ncbi:hypothetical protein IWZ01DRAFT_302345 [Phyllosticta capitalensis]
MLFSAVLLASSAALAAAQDFNAICATPGACLRIKQFFAIEPADPKSADHTAIEFNILNDNANFGASAECEADWPYGTEDWPKQRKDCSIPDFSFYFNGFNGDIDTDFVIEATAGYRDPAWTTDAWQSSSRLRHQLRQRQCDQRRRSLRDVWRELQVLLPQGRQGDPDAHIRQNGLSWRRRGGGLDSPPL